MADFGVPRVSQKDQAITHSIDELLDIITKYFTYQRECQQNIMKYFQMNRNKDTFYQKTIQRLAQVVVCMFPPEHTFLSQQLLMCVSTLATLASSRLQVCACLVLIGHFMVQVLQLRCRIPCRVKFRRKFCPAGI